MSTLVLILRVYGRTMWTGCTRTAAMQLMFGLYAALGLVALSVYRPLSPQVEIADEAPKAMFTDEQRRRLALKAKRLRRHILRQVATIVTDSSADPEEIVRLSESRDP